MKTPDYVTKASNFPRLLMRTKPHTTDIHSLQLEDEYFWMRLSDIKRSQRARCSNLRGGAYLEAENAYKKTVMAPTEALQTKLYDEIVTHQEGRRERAGVGQGYLPAATKKARNTPSPAGRKAHGR